MNLRQHSIRLFLVAIALFGFNACSVTGFGGPVSNVYCDNFLIYDMCAQDLNDDGVVEYVYFADTMDVFMFRDGADENIPSPHGMHRCAMPMDDDLVATTSRVFEVTDETSYLEKQDIRGAMMIKYMTYLPQVTTCNLRAEQAAAGEGS
ncbi:MAG: hypothetical protein GKR91_12230 [Pseudomonadales bacterium]|nr:hypothetical protein [Pseudomonadales bacterium]